MRAIDTLNAIRAYAGEAKTLGISDSAIEGLLPEFPELERAIAEAGEVHQAMQAEFGAAMRGSEGDLIALLQRDYVNFYSPSTLNPYVPLAARGPWVITSHGAVVHDSGGYGMLGLGHAPDSLLRVMAQPAVMANIMTPAFAHKRFADRLKREIGHTRGSFPFAKFLCLNSGSESVTVAARIADANAKRMTDPGGRYAGRTIKRLGIEGAFHGRTQRPASWSDSTRPTYTKHLATFRDDADGLWTVPANDIDALEAAFARADAEGVFFEAMFMEPVQGEGAPGRGMSRAFYNAARRLTLAHGSLLLVDSIQAGLRAHGTLSIVDYPGFQTAQAPDFETYSKALNGGQYPLSVLAMSERAANMYRAGIYGNTMTSNPRALEVACTVLDGITDALRDNVRRQGERFLIALRNLAALYPDVIVEVEGTGLLFCAELNPDRFNVIGPGSAEERCRHRGLGVIHGGRNALRFTPHFLVTDTEVDLMISVLADVVAELAEEARAAK